MEQTERERNPIELMEARSLRIHPVAQRSLTPSKVQRIYEEFDLDAIGTLHGVRYAIKGELATWIIDGHHRLEALLRHGFGEWCVQVEIHLDCQDDARAADLFLKLGFRTAHTAWDVYDKERLKRDPSVLGVEEIASKHGYRPAPTGGEGLLACVSALKSIFGIDAGQTLDRTLAVTSTAWGHTPAAAEGKLIEGLSRVLAVNNGNVDEAALVAKLAKYPGGPGAVLGAAKGLKQVRRVSLARCVAEVVIEEYNKGRRAHRLELP
jgi:hypothetical protein